MENHIVVSCYTNNKYIYIKFNRKMNISGIHSILNSDNFLLKDISSLNNKYPDSLCLSNLSCGIFCYDTDFVSFKLKNNILDFKNGTLYCGHINLSNIFHITDSNNYIYDFTCPSAIISSTEEPSLLRCVAKVTNNSSLILHDNNLIPFNTLKTCDFYIKKDNAKIHPYEIINNFDNTFTFNFKNEIIKRNSDIVSLCTNEKCYSTNVLNEPLLPNQCIETINELLTEPISLSIFSYINDVLGICLDFTDTIRRYDSNDFYFSINGKRYNAKGRQNNYKDNIIYFFIYDVFDFDYNFHTICVVYKNLKHPYTLNNNLEPINMPYKISSKTLYGISGIIDNISDANIGILNITFSNCLLSQKIYTKGYFDIFQNFKNKMFSKLILEHVSHFDSLDGNLPAFYIPNFGIILFYINENLNLSPSSQDVKIVMKGTKFIAEIDLFKNNFLNILKNKINYIEFIPLIDIKSCHYTCPLSTFEIPLTLLINDKVEEVYQPDEQERFNKLLGSTVSVPTTLLVSKEFGKYNFGDIAIDNKIVFLDSLYIKSISSPIIFEKPIIDVINIHGNILYVSLDDNYYINFDACHFEDVIIL